MKKTLFWKNKTVVVTGGTGFIGSHFVEDLLLSGANVICLYHNHDHNLNHLLTNSNLQLIKVDLCNSTQLSLILESVYYKPDALIHCAALDGNTEFKIREAAYILDANLRMNSNVLNWARDRKIENILILSSAEIYSPLAPVPLQEEDDYRQYIGYSENGYILSKIFSEILADLYRKQFGMNIFIVRPTNVYGPRDSYKVDSGRVIPTMIERINTGKYIEIWGDGSQTRSFIYVKDLINACLKLVEVQNYHVLNIGTNQSISILELAQLLSKICGVQSRIVLDKTKNIGVPSRVMDVTKLYRLLDIEPLSIEEGLRITIENDI